MTDKNEKPLREMTDEELQDSSMWDFEGAEQLPPPERKARAIVSVAFPGDAFHFVSVAAQNADMKISHFIREAAIEKAAAATVHLDAKATETAVYNALPTLPNPNLEAIAS